MDKNIAAILRSDTKTIRVMFTGGGNPKGYTYVTNLDLAPDDLVAVYASGEIKVATVTKVDDDLQIKPNSEMAFLWVICKIDTTEYEANSKRNAEIEKTLAVAYRANARAMYAQQMIAGAPEDQRARLSQLIDGAGELV